MKETHHCPICDKYLPLENFYVRKRGGPAGRCKLCANRLTQENQEERYLKRKKEFTALLGSCCSHCGYKKNLAALCFHHKDSSTKSFSVDKRSIHGRSMKVLLAEIKKCILLCSNCHMEEHYPRLNLN